MKVVICWAGISGYLSACWRALSSHNGIELKVIAAQSERAFDPMILRGFDANLVPIQTFADTQALNSLIAAYSPDVIVLCGWAYKAFREMPHQANMTHRRFIMTMDTPLKYIWRQRFARLRIGSFVDRMDRVVVAGERSWQYARRLLRVPESKLRRGMYAYDGDLFGGVYERRTAANAQWPRKFLYIGRYVPDKAIDILVEGYRQYRARVSDPWPLTCCGQGELHPLLNGITGLTDRGFVQPTDQPEVMVEHGAFVIASRYEPWGVVIAEALGSGLPVVCTEACGASVELVRSHFNGLTVATEDAYALSAGFHWAHESYECLPKMGRRGQQMAEAFSAGTWATRWAYILQELQSSVDASTVV